MDRDFELSWFVATYRQQKWNSSLFHRWPKKNQIAKRPANCKHGYIKITIWKWQKAHHGPYLDQEKQIRSPELQKLQPPSSKEKKLIILWIKCKGATVTHHDTIQVQKGIPISSNCILQFVRPTHSEEQGYQVHTRRTLRNGKLHRHASMVNFKERHRGLGCF